MPDKVGNKKGSKIESNPTAMTRAANVPADIEKYLNDIKSYFLVHHGMILKKNDCFTCALFHFLKAVEDKRFRAWEKITLATKSRDTIELAVPIEYYSKLKLMSGKMKLPTVHLMLLATMLVAEHFEENTDEDVSVVKEKFT